MKIITLFSTNVIIFYFRLDSLLSYKRLEFMSVVQTSLNLCHMTRGSGEGGGGGWECEGENLIKRCLHLISTTCTSQSLPLRPFRFFPVSFPQNSRPALSDLTFLFTYINISPLLLIPLLVNLWSVAD